MQDGRRVTDTILERVSTGAEKGSEGRLLPERNLPQRKSTREFSGRNGELESPEKLSCLLPATGVAVGKKNSLHCPLPGQQDPSKEHSLLHELGGASQAPNALALGF